MDYKRVMVGHEWRNSSGNLGESTLVVTDQLLLLCDSISNLKLINSLTG